MESINVEELRISIEGKLLLESPSAASCSIFRVPELIRRHNVGAYAPNVVSIGPYHKGGRPQFQFMQNVKHWYMQCLLKRCDPHTLDRLIEGVRKLDCTRDSYYQELEFPSLNEFVEIMILDGCFLLELFIRTNSVGLQDENDPIFNQNYMLEYLGHDLLLLENQIPWFVLECLYDLTSIHISDRSSDPRHTLFKLVVNFFRRYLGDVISMVELFDRSTFEVFHILDLIRTLLLSDSDPVKEGGPLHKSYFRRRWQMRIPSATTLEESGIKFEMSRGSIMFVKFKRGVFTIPFIKIDEMTEALLRNMIAFEQCHHSRPHKITSYAILMENLIHSTKDIDLLCKRGIITVDRLSHEDASKMFGNLCKDTALGETPCNELKDIFRKWMKNLKRDYLSTPWKVISWIAAFILLVLTLLQTVYTMKQYYNRK